MSRTPRKNNTRVASISQKFETPVDSPQVLPSVSQIPDGIPSSDSSGTEILKQLFSITQKAGELQKQLESAEVKISEIAKSNNENKAQLEEYRTTIKNFKTLFSVIKWVLGVAFVIISAMFLAIWFFLKPEIIFLHTLAGDEMAKQRVEKLNSK